VTSLPASSNNVASTLPQAGWYFSGSSQGLGAEFELFPSPSFWAQFKSITRIPKRTSNLI
jgi:hypothetical protein